MATSLIKIKNSHILVKHKYAHEIEGGVLYSNGVLQINNVAYPIIKIQTERALKAIKCVKMADQNLNMPVVDGVVKKFKSFPNLKKMIFGKNIDEIDEDAFFMFDGIEEVELSDNIAEIDDLCFGSCVNLKKIVLPKNLKKIGANAFDNCSSLEKIFIPRNVEFIDCNPFTFCNNLVSIEVDKFNDRFSSMGCNILFNKEKKELISICKTSKLIDDIEVIGEKVFTDTDVEEVVLPNSIKKLSSSAFYGNTKLKKIVLNEGLVTIGDYAFRDCSSLEEITLPKSVLYIGANAFIGCYNLNGVGINMHMFLEENWDLLNIKNRYFYSDDKVFSLNKVVVEGAEYSDSSCSLNLTDIDDNVYILGEDKNLIILNKNEIVLKYGVEKGYQSLSLGEFDKIVPWLKYKNLPVVDVIKSMPKQEIDLFYKNNNFKNWHKIQISAREKYNEEANINGSGYNVEYSIIRSSLFDIAHALGVFCNDGLQSKIATEYIINKIINQFTLEEIHRLTSGFSTYNTPYNEDFAKFFIKNFNGFQFLTYKDEETQIDVNYLVACHNHFADILKAYPNKKVVSRQRNEVLSTEIVLNYLRSVSYENLQSQDEINLASVVSPFGYTQESFDNLKQWYYQGKKIKMDKKEKLFVEPDDKNNVITYELLEKDSVLSAVLGDLTNCCQKENANGRECVQYGMTKPNSGFIVFKDNGELIGQSWVWYDEQTKQITLDNIEVPTKQLKKLETVEKSDNFIKCLKRLAKGFVNSMQKKGFDVKNVTIGLGFNDINSILINNFKEIKEPKLLTDYTGYTDCKKQVLLYSVKLSNNMKNFMDKGYKNM